MVYDTVLWRQAAPVSNRLDSVGWSQHTRSRHRTFLPANLAAMTLMCSNTSSCFNCCCSEFVSTPIGTVATCRQLLYHTQSPELSEMSVDPHATNDDFIKHILRKDIDIRHRLFCRLLSTSMHGYYASKICMHTCVHARMHACMRVRVCINACMCMHA